MKIEKMEGACKATATATKLAMSKRPVDFF
jgi:hypothetical protein